MQGEQGVAGCLALYQQREPLCPETNGHLVHLPVGGEEHQARLFTCQQAWQGANQLVGKGWGVGLMGHLGQIELGLLVIKGGAQTQIAGAVVLLQTHLVAEIAKGGEGGQGGRDQHCAKAPGPEPLF